MQEKNVYKQFDVYNPGGCLEDLHFTISYMHPKEDADLTREEAYHTHNHSGNAGRQ